MRIAIALLAALLVTIITGAAVSADHTFGESPPPYNELRALPPPLDSASHTVAVLGLDDAQTRDALRTWNAAVGWELFAIVADGADVTIEGGARSYAEVSATRCQVTVHNNAADAIAHELGHCIGLNDHLVPACEPEAYRGLMSYCAGRKRINSGDLAALRRLGYATTCTVTVQSEGQLAAVVTRGACSIDDVLARTGGGVVWALAEGLWEWGPHGPLTDIIGTYALVAVRS